MRFRLYENYDSVRLSRPCFSLYPLIYLIYSSLHSWILVHLQNIMNNSLSLIHKKTRTSWCLIWEAAVYKCTVLISCRHEHKYVSPYLTHLKFIFLSNKKKAADKLLHFMDIDHTSYKWDTYTHYFSYFLWYRFKRVNQNNSCSIILLMYSNNDFLFVCFLVRTFLRYPKEKGLQETHLQLLTMT